MTINKTVNSAIARLFLAITARLIAVSGPLNGKTFYLDEAVVSIGRLESNDVCLEDPFVSRHHCVIRKEGDEYLIEDLSSANGTYLNGERINAAALKEGCVIAIGASQFIFKLQTPEETITLGQNLVVAKKGHPPSDEFRSA